jgi:hypothetical protein
MAHMGQKGNAHGFEETLKEVDSLEHVSIH